MEGGAAAGDTGGSDEGSGDAGWSFPRHVCVANGTGALITQSHDCRGVDQLTISNPKVGDVEGGPVAPGTSGRVEVLVTVPQSSQGWGYPCVGFAADNAGVSFTESDPVFNNAFGLAAGQSETFSIGVQVSSSLLHGTVVRFVAWADSLNQGCTNGAELNWNVTLQ